MCTLHTNFQIKQQNNLNCNSALFCLLPFRPWLFISFVCWYHYKSWCWHFTSPWWTYSSQHDVESSPSPCVDSALHIIPAFMTAVMHRIRIRQKEKQRSSLPWLGDRIECLTSHYSQDDLKKRMNWRTDTWVLWKNKDHSVHTTPNSHPPKMDVLPKICLQIILASPNQQRQLLPSLLSDSYFMPSGFLPLCEHP